MLSTGWLTWASYQVPLPLMLCPENVGKMVLYLSCRVVARINLDVLGKGIGQDSAKLGSPGKNLSEVFGV